MDDAHCTQTSVVKLSWLTQHLPEEVIKHVPVITGLDVEVTGIAMDSRQVKPGYIFVALRGGNTDGHRFIPAALAKGAVAIVGADRICNIRVPYIRVTDPRKSLAHLSAAFYHFPARRMTMIGVTGTDGKTTTSSLIYQILVSAGVNAGMITTVNAVFGDEILDTGFHVTTPEAPDVQNYLAQMAYHVPRPVTHVVLESTSHGLNQHRVTGCDFDIGVITNITHEHLDYHKTFDDYRDAKARLFRLLAETPTKKQGNIRLAVLNRDDPSYLFFSELVARLKPPLRQVSYGISVEAEIRATNIAHKKGKLFFEIVGIEYRLPIECNLVGSFNVLNCLAAFAATSEGLKIDQETIKEGIDRFKSIPGRMESVDLGQEFKIIVDFAHTPNALKNALNVARELCNGRIIAVFGSAGLRDREKRRMMAEISTQLADITILTAEDPRTESIETILKEMAAGAESWGGKEGLTFWRIPDRREAIRFAVNFARSNDLVIVCGKGHEQSMCFGQIEYSWDDRIAVKAALSELLGIPGTAMPYLPN
jgi:UDP-N-acetylmuramoyl-L-alanyl-D-glutamate--2,6-diaminopimelate ligase